MSDKVTILIPGNANSHALSRLEKAFNIIQLKDGDLSNLSDAEISSIRGAATFGSPITPAFVDALPSLEVVASFGVGYDHVDAKYAASKNVVATHTPSVLDDEVADTCIGLLLNTIRELPRAENWLRDGKWKSEGNFRLSPLTLRDRTVGIFGMGRIGQAIAKRLEAFGVAIHYHKRTPVDGSNYVYHESLEDLAEAVDTLINVVPSTPETAKAINAAVLKKLGTNGVFVNIGRGTTVDDDALIAALENKVIAAAGLDVFTDEPNVPEGYLKLDNACLLPHVGSGSIHTRKAMADLVVDNLVNWFDGNGAISAVPECKGLKGA